MTIFSDKDMYRPPYFSSTSFHTSGHRCFTFSSSPYLPAHLYRRNQPNPRFDQRELLMSSTDYQEDFKDFINSILVTISDIVRWWDFLVRPQNVYTYLRLISLNRIIGTEINSKITSPFSVSRGVICKFSLDKGDEKLSQ